MAFGSTRSLVVAAALLFAPPPVPAETNPGVPFELVQQHLVVDEGSHRLDHRAQPARSTQARFPASS